MEVATSGHEVARGKATLLTARLLGLCALLTYLQSGKTRRGGKGEVGQKGKKDDYWRWLSIV